MTSNNLAENSGSREKEHYSVTAIFVLASSSN